MKLVIKDDKVLATHDNNQEIESFYPGCDFVIDDNFSGDLHDDYKITEQVRKTQFCKNFFEIPDYGWYRKQPKGYSSAIESINTAFNAVSLLKYLPEDYLIFYTAPNFNDEYQCKDTWLIANQVKNQQMNVEEFGIFYKKFVEAWNDQEHK